MAVPLRYSCSSSLRSSSTDTSSCECRTEKRKRKNESDGPGVGATISGDDLSDSSLDSGDDDRDTGHEMDVIVSNPACSRFLRVVSMRLSFSLR